MKIQCNISVIDSEFMNLKLNKDNVLWVYVYLFNGVRKRVCRDSIYTPKLTHT